MRCGSTRKDDALNVLFNKVAWVWRAKGSGCSGASHLLNLPAVHWATLIDDEDNVLRYARKIRRSKVMNKVAWWSLREGQSQKKKVRLEDERAYVFDIWAGKELLVHLDVAERGVPVDVVNDDQVSVHPLVITAVTGFLLVHCWVEMNPRLKNTHERMVGLQRSGRQHWSFWGAVSRTSFSSCVVVMALASALVLRPPLTIKELMPAFSLMYTSTCSQLEKISEMARPKRMLVPRFQCGGCTLKSLTGCMGLAWICNSYFPSLLFSSSSYVSSKVTFLWAATVTEVLNSSSVRPTELQKRASTDNISSVSLMEECDGKVAV